MLGRQDAVPGCRQLWADDWQGQALEAKLPSWSSDCQAIGKRSRSRGTRAAHASTSRAATAPKFASLFGFGHGGFIQQVSPTDRLRRPLASALYCICPASMIDDCRSMVCSRRLCSAERSPFRVAAACAQAVGTAKHLRQSCCHGHRPARALAIGADHGACAPHTCQLRWWQQRPSSPADVALATAATYNKAAQRIAFGDRWPLRCIALSGEHD